MNTRTNQGNTALMAAVQNNNVGLITNLIDNGADITCMNNSGETAQNLAKTTKKDNIILLLILAEIANGKIPQRKRYLLNERMKP